MKTLIAFFLFVSASFAAEKQYLVETKPRNIGKLSPILVATRDCKGTLVGVSELFRPIIRTEDPEALQKSLVVNSVSEEIPEINPVRALRIVYVQPISDETLAELKLKKIEDYELGNFIVVQGEAITTEMIQKLDELPATKHINVVIKMRAIPEKK